MGVRDFDSILLDVFHELQERGPFDKIIEAISEIPKVKSILDKFGVAFRVSRFTEWCKVISENLDENDLEKLIQKIEYQGEKYDLSVFKEF